nr:PilZ domain-containing protein [Desulfobulbus rhabdoformis]
MNCNAVIYVCVLAWNAQSNTNTNSSIFALIIFVIVASITKLLKKIKDHAPTIVDIPAKTGEDYRCKAVLRKRNGTAIELVFPPNSWEQDNLPIGANCNLAVEHQGESLNLVARLDEVSDARRLLFTAREPISPESLREFFRVLINIPIEASYIASPREVKAKTWKMLGTTIDLSGSGVLAVFAEKPPTNHNIQLVMTMPEDEPSVVCLADVVRTYRLRKNRYQVAFHYEVISQKARDQVISSCFQEQRRQLRENVQTAR